MKQQVRLALASLLAAASASVAGLAYADVVVEGDVSPENPTDPWDLGSSPLVVNTISHDPARVTVSNRGTLISAGAYVGRASYGTGTVEVLGYGSRWLNSGSIEIAFGDSEGVVAVRRGAQVTTDALVVGAGADSIGNVFVEGYDATLTSRTDVYIPRRGVGRLALRQGASFFSNNTSLGRCRFCLGMALATGAWTRWVNTGDFAVGGGGVGRLDVYAAELSTVNARIEGDPGIGRTYVTVSGWGGTWTNQGLLRVGVDIQFGEFAGEVSVGAYGTLVTEDTEIHSRDGGAFVAVNDVYASWINSGDVTVLASRRQSPSLVVDGGGLVRVGGLLRSAPLVEGEPDEAPSVRLADGELVAAGIEVGAGDFDFAGGRLSAGVFVGDLVNTQAGELVVGDAYSSTAIAGAYSQGPGAALHITVGGPGAAPILDVDGDVSLGGVLEVVAAEGSAPFQAGDNVVLLGFTGALSGAFDEVNIVVPLADGLAWDTSALYTTGVITVVAAG
ncbi:hypothetical protein SOCE26_084660 [Sorangium cellulosum]|uniref:Secreted protein n=1 Tax=Sorangium cellulosum TaxID=56 RepID=A0A2L0F5W3_SORCE|nr:hypothetical protein [Sorangium cellulosum]AUX46956.1 hypothetical protein SOCE26_084660 [Sorangium cellulosum]